MLIEQNEFSLFKNTWISNNQIVQYFVLNNPDPSAVLAAISFSYIKSFNAFNSSVKSLDPNLLHEWRKRLKDVQYQLELVYDNLNQEVQKHTLKIQVLCDLLGELNDLDMMNHWIGINQDKITSENSLRATFSKGLINKQKELLGNVISNGDELYSFAPDTFREKLF